MLDEYKHPPQVRLPPPAAVDTHNKVLGELIRETTERKVRKVLSTARYNSGQGYCDEKTFPRKSLVNIEDEIQVDGMIF